MSAELKEVRPGVISRTTRHCLEEYRGFRHVVRNIYTFKLHTNRIASLAATLETCFEMVQEDLSVFALQIEEIAD